MDKGGTSNGLTPHDLKFKPFSATQRADHSQAATAAGQRRAERRRPTYGVLDDQRQQQHAVDVAQVQRLAAHRDALALGGDASLACTAQHAQRATRCGGGAAARKLGLARIANALPCTRKLGRPGRPPYVDIMWPGVPLAQPNSAPAPPGPPVQQYSPQVYMKALILGSTTWRKGREKGQAGLLSLAVMYCAHVRGMHVWCPCMQGTYAPCPAFMSGRGPTGSTASVPGCSQLS